MHRIDSSGNVDGLFSDGNPQAGQVATRLTPDWFNDVQENLLTVLAQADIVPVKGAFDQLYLAIVALIAAAGVGGGGGGGTYVEITRLINTSGLLTGGGSLANNLNLAVAKASAAEAAAGALDTKAITPLALAGAFVSSFGANGYCKLPGGLILQWGTGTALQSSNNNFSLPIAFPTACLFAAVEGGAQNTNAVENFPYISGKGTTTLSVYNAYDSNLTCNFFALGY